MVDGTVDRKRIEAAVRRLQVLPERKAEISKAVTGLLYVVQKAASTDGAVDAPPPEEPKSASEPEVDEASLVAAKELRESQWLIHDFREAADAFSEKAQEALSKHAQSAGLSIADVGKLFDRLGRVAEAMAAAADALETPDAPEPAPAPKAKPEPDDPALVIAQHAARMYTRLTGKKLPKPKGKDGAPRGPFFWLLEDIFAGAGILESAAHYTNIVTQD